MTGYAATLERLSLCRLATHERLLSTRADGSPEQILSTRHCEILRDGLRANLLVDEVNYPHGVTPAEAGKPGKEGYANEFNYVCGEQVLEVFYPHDVFDVRPPLPRGVMGRLAPQASDEFYVSNAMGHAGIAFGLTSFVSPMPVSKLVRLDQNTVTKDDLGYCVQGASKDGTRHKIWFDPEASFVIRRLIFEQSGETLSDNRFQYNRRILNSRFGFDDKTAIKSVTLELRNVQVEPRNETHVITSVDSIRTIVAENGTKALESSFHTLSDWDLAPVITEQSFQPRLPVPEGAHVVVEDTRSLEYEYRNGRIQLTVHKDTLEPLERVRLPNRPAAPRMQWIWAVVAGGLCVAWWKLRSDAS
ncbi:MAG: hypothetical protein JSS49_09425 [Planctomycetes bacterium]|nr:hypothetical protein [Planctomycetota bacterium]